MPNPLLIWDLPLKEHLSMSRLSFRMNPLFFLLAFGLGWLNSQTPMQILLWAIVIFISILVHELGHALTALVFGQSAVITFLPIGGLTSRIGPPLSSWKEFIIVLNGPLAGFALYYFCRFLLHMQSIDPHSNIGFSLVIGTYVNLFWTVLNLFPVLPLDGGRLMWIISESIFGVRGGKIAYFVSFLCAVLFALFFFVIQQLFAGAIFALFAFESWRGYGQMRHVLPIDENKEFKQGLERGVVLYSQGRMSEAVPIFQQVRENTKEGQLYLNATYYLAKSLEDRQEYDEAFLLLNREKKKLDMERLEMLQRLAFQSGRYQEAAKIGQELFSEEPNPETAFINALSLAQQKEVGPAVGWFKTAIDEGLENPLISSRHLAFDPIRNTEAFKALLGTLQDS